MEHVQEFVRSLQEMIDKVVSMGARLNEIMSGMTVLTGWYPGLDRARRALKLDR